MGQHVFAQLEVQVMPACLPSVAHMNLMPSINFVSLAQVRRQRSSRQRSQPGVPCSTAQSAAVEEVGGDKRAHPVKDPPIAATMTAAAAASTAVQPVDAPKHDNEVTVEHLIVGVLLFTPLLALLPTTMVWYLAASAAHGAVVMFRLCLNALAYTCLHNPVYMLLRRSSSPQLFPSELGGLPCRLGEPWYACISNKSLKSS
jgi:hypothetical protein